MIPTNINKEQFKVYADYDVFLHPVHSYCNFIHTFLHLNNVQTYKRGKNGKKTFQSCASLAIGVIVKTVEIDLVFTGFFQDEMNEIR